MIFPVVPGNHFYMGLNVSKEAIQWRWLKFDSEKKRRTIITGPAGNEILIEGGSPHRYLLAFSG